MTMVCAGHLLLSDTNAINLLRPTKNGSTNRNAIIDIVVVAAKVTHYVVWAVWPF